MEDVLSGQWSLAMFRGDYETAFDRAQKLLQSIRARNDRTGEHVALLRFAELLARAGDTPGADRVRRYLASGFPRVPRAWASVPR